MSIAGIGIDIVSIERFEQILARHGDRFLARISRSDEVRPVAASQRAQHVSGLFAAKEAVLKALGTGWDQGLGFRQVEVRREAGGRPTIRLHDAAAELARRLGVAEVHVSITHDQGMAAAIAVLEAGDSR